MAMPLKPRVCPISDIPLAAQTIASVMCWNNPLISFLYDRDRPPPPPPAPPSPPSFGRTVRQTRIVVHLPLPDTYRGLVLTVDDDDLKCVVVAVWTAPFGKGSLARLRIGVFSFGGMDGDPKGDPRVSRSISVGLRLRDSVIFANGYVTPMKFSVD